MLHRHRELYILQKNRRQLRRQKMLKQDLMLQNVNQTDHQIKERCIRRKSIERVCCIESKNIQLFHRNNENKKTTQLENRIEQLEKNKLDVVSLSLLFSLEMSSMLIWTEKKNQGMKSTISFILKLIFMYLTPGVYPSTERHPLNGKKSQKS